MDKRIISEITHKKTGRVNFRGKDFFEIYNLCEKDDITGCINWIGSRDVANYGRLQVDGKTKKAHRESYERHNNVKIPSSVVVMHSCDNPCCVNPLHLSAGSYADNNRDRTQKGRSAKCSKNGNARLKESDVLSIREDKRFYNDIAKSYGIAKITVSAIKRRVIWKSI